MPERNGVGMGCPPESVPALILGLAPLPTTSRVALIMSFLRAARLTTLATKLRLHQAARRCSFSALPAKLFYICLKAVLHLSQSQNLEKHMTKTSGAEEKVASSFCTGDVGEAELPLALPPDPGTYMYM